MEVATRHRVPSRSTSFARLSGIQRNEYVGTPVLMSVRGIRATATPVNERQSVGQRCDDIRSAADLFEAPGADAYLKLGARQAKIDQQHRENSNGASQQWSRSGSTSSGRSRPSYTMSCVSLRNIDHVPQFESNHLVPPGHLDSHRMSSHDIEVELVS